MKKIGIINGPNLNLLGTREVQIYGTRSFEDFFQELEKNYSGVELVYYQSNVEGEMINKLHEWGYVLDGIILNAGGYTHTSIAIGDAVAAIKSPVIEVHLSNIFTREDFRHVDMIAKKCTGLIAGFGLESYHLALIHLMGSTLKKE